MPNVPYKSCEIPCGLLPVNSESTCQMLQINTVTPCQQGRETLFSPREERRAYDGRNPHPLRTQPNLFLSIGFIPEVFEFRQGVSLVGR